MIDRLNARIAELEADKAALVDEAAEVHAQNDVWGARIAELEAALENVTEVNRSLRPSVLRIAELEALLAQHVGEDD